MNELKGSLLEGVDNEVVFSAIREKLKPLLDPSLQETEEEEDLLDNLRSSCDRVLTPFREFLETELSQFDYKYNDVVGFEEGKWSAEVHLMLQEGIYFTENDIELLQNLGRPIWVLTIELSLVFPAYLMAIEKWELSRTRKNWIDCTAVNERLGDFSSPAFKIKKYLEETGFHIIPKKSLGVIVPREVTGAKIVIRRKYEEFTVVQLLFNELFDSDIDILTFDNYTSDSLKQDGGR